MESSLHKETETIKEPFLKNSTKGGLRTLPFILASETLEKVANYGVSPDMPLYLMNEYHMEMTTSSNILFYWSAAFNFMPIIGALIADTYVGRFNMIAFGCIVNFLGMAVLWLTAAIPGARPPPCDELATYCSSATIPQLVLLCTSFIVIAIGIGGTRSCTAPFGVDQLENVDQLGVDEDGYQKERFLQRYFAWYVATYDMGILIAYSGVVFFFERIGWKFGFGFCLLVMMLSVLLFFLGDPFYVKVKTEGNLILEFIQVIFASCKNRHLELSSSENVNMSFHHKKGSSLMLPTENLRFLNKACIIQNVEQELTSEGTAKDPWSLCTVNQVENLKAILKVTPFWSTSVLLFATMTQGSFSIVQITSLDRKIIGNFEIPAGSFGSLVVISIVLWLISYDQIILPLISRIRGKPTYFSGKQRMGAGILVSCVSLIVSAVVERTRRDLAIKQGLSDYPDQGVQMSALWLVPQCCLSGIAEGLYTIAQSEFYTLEFPKCMYSIGTAFSLVGMSLGNLLASFLMSTIHALTKRGGQESWISTNINKGHYDYYFWFLSGLSMLNFIYFLLCCRTYGPSRHEEQARDDEDVSG